MEKSEEDLIAVMKALVAAHNAHNLDAVTAFLTDDVVYKIGPPGALSVISVGKQQLRDAVKGLITGLRLETWDCRVSGNRLTGKFRNSADIYRNMGVDFVDGSIEVFFRGDKIESFHVTYSPESVRKLWAAQEGAER